MNVFGKQSGSLFTGHLQITQPHDLKDPSFEVLYDFEACLQICECVTLIAFQRQQWRLELAALLVYTYIASLVCFCEGFGGEEVGLPLSSRLRYRCQTT
jgi:hypothetical protein